MRKAKVGEYDYTLREFLLAFGSDYQRKGIKPVCPECGGAVQTYDRAGAHGFLIVGNDVARRERGLPPRRAPGFQHMKGAAKPDCSLAKPYDPRYEALLDGNDIDPSERPISRAIFEEPTMKAALDDVFEGLYFTLTGRAPDDEIKKEYLKKCREQLYHIRGLSQHPWALPYAAICLFGPQDRKTYKGSVVEAVFAANGRQMLGIVTARGEKKVAKVPQKLTICFAKERGEPVPMRRGHGGSVMEYEVSRAAAYDIVKAVRLARMRNNQPLLI